MADIADDLRYALRTLRRSPAFVTGVVLTLALVLAASVTVFGIVDRVLLRPLPYADPERLFTVFQADSTGQNAALPSYPTARDYQARARAFAGIGFVRGNTTLLRGTDGARRLGIAWVSPGFLQLIGVRPALGRLFTAEEERADGGGVIVISHSLWQRELGADPAVIGRTISLEDGTFTVVGVLPLAFKYPDWADAWTPVEPKVATSEALQNRLLHVDSRTVARLAPGATLASAKADLDAVQRQLDTEYPDPAGRWTSTRLTPISDETIGPARSSLFALAGAVAFVLLIACANVANLTLVRASARSREIAVRVALGAGRARIARQLITESAVLAIVAGVIGTILATLAIGAIHRWAPPGLPRIAELSVDWRTLAGAGGLTMLAAVLIGVIPAVRAGRTGFEALRHTRGSVGGGVRGARARTLLTVGQMSLALMLMIGSGLLVQSFRRLQDRTLGFEPRNALALQVFPSKLEYESEDASRELYRRLIERLAAVPGVTSVAFINHAPMGGAAAPTTVSIAGREPDPSGNDRALYKTVSAGYLEAAGLRLVRGRWFSASDVDAKSVGIVISASVARRFFGEADPIGRPITVRRASQARKGFGEASPGIVIGVVENVREFGQGQDGSDAVYVPYTREVWDWGNIIVRTSGDPQAVVPSLQRAVREVDADIPVTGSSRRDGFRPLTDLVDGWVQPRRIGTALLFGFSEGALILAALGLYTVTSYGVVQRMNELGVRMALGATPRNVQRLVLGQALRLAVAGAVIGAMGAVVLGKTLESMLFATRPSDPVAIGAAALSLGIVVLLASLAPARRAARVDPVIAMRGD